jgi:hypothetical protein
MKNSFVFVTGVAGAVLWGTLFVLGGILGFVPGITRDEMFLGVFMVNTPHNILHIVSGVVFFIGAISGARAARLCFLTIGVFYAALSLIGFEVGNGLIFNLISNTPIDSWGHGFLALVLLVSGVATPKPSCQDYACCKNHEIAKS